MRRLITYSTIILALGVTACGDEEQDLTADQLAVMQSLSSSATAWTEESPGAEGIVAELALGASIDGPEFAPGDSFHRPAYWGRFRRDTRPSRDRIVVIEGDTAQVTTRVTFDGILVVDTSFDGTRNPGRKPIHETARQHALLVRDSTAPHGWRLIGISPRRIQNTDPVERTVNLTSVAVRRNSDAPVVVTDPSALHEPGSLASLVVGDTLRVRVQVSNTTGSDLIPPTQMFIHVRHAQPGIDAWGRFPMHRENDTTFVAHWVVRRPGRAVVAVDAIDSETLATQGGDNYRADVWAVPVVVAE